MSPVASAAIIIGAFGVVLLIIRLIGGPVPVRSLPEMMERFRPKPVTKREKIPFGRTVLDEFSTASGDKTKFDDVGGCYFYIHFDSPTLHALIVDGIQPYVLKIPKHTLLEAALVARRILDQDSAPYDRDEAFLDAILMALAIEPKEDRHE